MSDHAISNAKAWLDSIVETMTALREAGESDKIECGQCEGNGWLGLMGADTTEECPICDGTGQIDREEDEDAIHERIQQEPLSVEVRSGWGFVGTVLTPAEFCILLSTGGPALRLVGELDEGQPWSLPRLEWQDWGTPWTPIYDTTEEQDEALLAYAREFYFAD